MSRVLTSLLLFGLLLGAVQISNAQTNPNYVLSVRGDVVPFDSAVIVKLKQYRKETLLLNRQESLTQSLNFEVSENHRLTAQLRRILETEKSFSMSLSKTIQEKELLLTNQRILIERLRADLEKPLPFYQHPLVTGSLGILVGFLIAK